MKDIIYPTIKRQFDKLSPHITYDDDGDMTVEFFYGNSDGEYLIYEGFIDTLRISTSYFMLNYFGYNENNNEFNNLLSSIFTELINNKLMFPVIPTEGGNGPTIRKLK